MATVATKTPDKPKMEKKEPTPVPAKVETSQENEHESENQNKFQNNRGGRENKFQNKRGGRHSSRGFGNRGGFQGRIDNGGGGGGGGPPNNQGSNSNQQFGDFMGEQNDGPKEQKKFTGRCRLFVGNITPDTTEEQFKEMFTPFGEVSEVFVNAARGFGFIRLDYRINAEKAKMDLDGQMRHNRVLRVRFATHGAALRVYNLSPFVSNELLETAFSQFGEVERAVVFVDDRGKSLCEGLVEFARKPGAQAAFKRISEGIFMLSSYPRPVRVEMLEQRDEEDGLTEKFVQRNDGFRQDREKEPRFAPPGSFEFEFGNKYRDIDKLEKDRIERVKQEMELERQRLVEEMETAMFDFQAEQIRNDLMRQQEELKRLDEMKNEHMRRRQESDMRRRQQLGAPPPDSMMRQEEERRREMMMRASNEMNRGRDGNRSNRPDDMMRDVRDGPGGMLDGAGRMGDRGRPITPPMPMAPPPVPPGMDRPGMDRPGMDRPGMDRPGMDRPGMDRPGMDRPVGPPGPMDSGRFDRRPGSPGGDRPSNMELDRPPNMDRPPHGDHMQRAGPVGPPGRFSGPQKPPGQGNFPPPGPGGRFPGPGGHMGPNNPNMRGGDRRDAPRREDFDAKRMRRF